MKCRAKQVSWAQDEKRIMTEYGLWALDYLESLFAVRLVRSFPYFRREGGLQSYYDGQASLCEVSVNDKVADKLFVRDRHQGRREADEGELLDDAIDNAQYSLERELDAIGFPYENWRALEVSAPSAAWAGKTVEAVREVRRLWYDANGVRATQVWMASGILWLADQRFPSGKRRFSIPAIAEKIYKPAAAEMVSFYTAFLRGRREADEVLKRQAEAMHRELYAEYGVEFGPVEGETALEIRSGLGGRKFADAPVSGKKSTPAENVSAAREITEAFDEAMRDVKRGYFRRLGL